MKRTIGEYYDQLYAYRLGDSGEKDYFLKSQTANALSEEIDGIKHMSMQKCMHANAYSDSICNHPNLEQHLSLTWLMD